MLFSFLKKPRIQRKKKSGGPGRGHKKTINSLNNVFVNINNKEHETNSDTVVEIIITSSAHGEINNSASQKKLNSVNSFFKESENAVNSRLDSGNVIINISILSKVGKVIKPVFRSLADPHLLSRCLHGKTLNPKESFSSAVWTRIPKTVFEGHDTLRICALDAVLTFNEGNVGRVKVLQCLGIDPGVNAVKSFEEIDNQRTKTKN